MRQRAKKDRKKTAGEAKPKTGRPLLNIDPRQVEQLAAIDCSYAEMAAVLDCDPKTLSNRFSQVIQKGRERGCASLKRKQFELAMSGDKTMLIWLGKQRLGQAEQQRIRIGDLGTLSDEELRSLAAGQAPAVSGT